jgi:hypothetical protein
MQFFTVTAVKTSNITSLVLLFICRRYKYIIAKSLRTSLADKNPYSSRAVAQPISRRIATAAAWVLSRVKSCEICGGQTGRGAGFLLFPLPLIHSTNYSTIITTYNLGLVQWAYKWSQ